MPTADQKDVASRILTRREQQIVGMVCAGHQNKAIASALGISEGSVKQHLNRIYRKFGGRKRRDRLQAKLHV
jgi:DNA-binding CsgD family transcriptional regulator